MNNFPALCSLPDVETHVQIPVPLSLLRGLDMIEGQTCLMLNLISALRPELADFSGCRQTPWWFPPRPSHLPFISFVQDAYTNSLLSSQLLQRGTERELVYIYPQKYISLITEVCCLRFNFVDTHLIAQGSATRFCFAADRSEEVQSLSLANLLFTFTERS